MVIIKKPRNNCMQIMQSGEQAQKQQREIFFCCDLIGSYLTKLLSDSFQVNLRKIDCEIIRNHRVTDLSLSPRIPLSLHLCSIQLCL